MKRRVARNARVLAVGVFAVVAVIATLDLPAGANGLSNAAPKPVVLHGNADGGRGTVTLPANTAASFGPIALQVMGCRPILDNVYTNHVASAAAPGNVVTTGAITDTGVVTSPSPGAQDVKESSTVHDLNALTGLVHATTLRSVAHTSFTPLGGYDNHLSDGTTGATLTALTVAGQSFAANPPPNTTQTIAVPGGPTITVTLNEQTPKPHGVDVTALHLIANDAITGLHLDIRIANAHTASGPAQPLYSGYAYATQIQAPPAAASGRQSVIYMPCPGTNNQDRTASVVELDTPGLFNTGQAVSTVNGGTNGFGPVSTAHDRIEHLVIGPALTPVLKADAVESTATSQGTAGLVTSSATVNVVNLVVAGQTINGAVPQDQMITIPGVGYVIFNEQACQSDGAPGHNCTDPAYDGITVKAIHLVVTAVNPFGLPKGLDLRITVSHSDLRL